MQAMAAEAAKVAALGTGGGAGCGARCTFRVHLQRHLAGTLEPFGLHLLIAPHGLDIRELENNVSNR